MSGEIFADPPETVLYELTRGRSVFLVKEERELGRSRRLCRGAVGAESADLRRRMDQLDAEPFPRTSIHGGEYSPSTTGLCAERKPFCIAYAKLFRGARSPIQSWTARQGHCGQLGIANSDPRNPHCVFIVASPPVGKERALRKRLPESAFRFDSLG
jgi:hypothetical protein